MKRGSLLAGLRPRDDESETELEGEEAPESEAPKPPKKAASRATPEQTRALDLRIFEAADRLEAQLGRAPTLPEIANAAKVPGASADSRRIRVGKALRHRALLTEQAKKVQVARVSPDAVRAVATLTTGPAPGVRAVEDLRDRLRAQLAAVEVTLEALRGEP